jgi:hypothetical protein
MPVTGYLERASDGGFMEYQKTTPMFDYDKTQQNIGVRTLTLTFTHSYRIF